MYEKRGYLLSDFRLFHLNDAQGTRVEYHYHEFHKLLFLRSGTGTYYVDGKTYTLQAGDLVFIGSRQMHRPEFEKGMPYERIILYIAPEFLQKNSTENCRLEDCFRAEGAAWEDRTPVLRLKEKERSRLFLLVERLEKELSEENYGAEVACKGLLLRLLVEIGRNIRNREQEIGEKKTDGSGKRSPSGRDAASLQQKRVRAIMRYLDTHLSEELRMDDLSERFFVSKYHMMRQFKEETGQSVGEYVTERRLLAAREFIRQGKSATESCFLSGFGCYSSFTRAYAKRFGTTPTGRAGHHMKREETYE